MVLFFHLILLVALSFVLGRAAGWVARSAHLIAKRLNTNDFIIGFFIVGVATSTPEITVAISSALERAPGLSLGNLLGASIILLTLLAGLAAMLAGKLSVNKFLRNDDFFLYLLLTALPVAAVLDGRLSRWDGVLLIAAYFLFAIKMYRRRHLYKNQFAVVAPPPRAIRLNREVTILLVALAAMMTAAYYLVNSALFIASAWHIPPVVLGLLILSISTNLPEFVLVITQSYKKSQNIVLGDLMSNVLLNVPTLGLLALISPFTISQPASITISAIFLLISVAAFGFLMWSKNMLTRAEGTVLVVLYVFYAASNLAALAP